ncbi:MAG TPA: SDR family oxidoreductase [Planctomycetota bacterium]|nr:SDR family oxidoreductase [Planctomycetota bacterium]
MGKLDGRVAVITGASRGIGKQIALLLAKEGCDIVVAAKTSEPDPRLPGTIHDTAREVEALGRRALPVKCDVRETDQIDAMAQQALDTFGKIDILINNAGALWWYPVLDTPPKKFDLVMDVNARASFFCARACLPSMIKNRWGHIINMSPPIDVRLAGYHVAYMISKYGMTLIAHGLAEEVKEHNVAVNALWPVTIIESQATINFGLLPRQYWRTADIVADATLAIVSKDPAARTGQALLDEDVLRAEGVTDFAKYRCDPETEPVRIDWEMIKAAAQMAGQSGIGARPRAPA